MFRQYNIFLLSLGVLSSSLLADIPKQALKTNGQLLYQKQKNIDTLSEMITQGTLYGRVRSNNFYFAYDHDDADHKSAPLASIGASVVYKSASLSGFDLTLGYYGSKAVFNEHALDTIAHLKPAKDTLSRLEYANNGSTALYALGQANINYTYSKTAFTLGRQLVETFYTKSNDTKMIPNTFDGLVVHSKDIQNTKMTFAYLVKQKLRDHTQSHSVFMVGDSASASDVLHPEWTQNDDGAMLKGLTYTALVKAGKPTDAPLIVLDLENRSIQNLKINFSAYTVPELLSQAMGELNYKIHFNGFNITSGVRYIQQFDHGAGGVAGASLSVLPIGSTAYTNPNSLDSQMIAARIVTKVDDYKLNLAFTNILNQADLVTPWRGFPTAGYTRSMGIYNWKANTESYRIELVKGANAKAVYTTPFIQTSILYIDGDANKSSLADSMFYYAGIVQNIPSMPALQYKVRLGYRDFINSSSSISNYLDSRLEFNYLF